ncbi:hypothetical protein LB465_11485 [Salegentibacter sp. LM13S]|uniref:hypothetical protein n=1 Tax=Salegentibacter lacus TaxID=2873599 RepID=UPI001CCA1D7B|nr:hypothetical protein [Salegentibacter lacus]MBZ9631403.1 hypothetical protein [Salegentibacter lacus]
MMLLFLSCNNNEDQIHAEEKSNGFFFNSNFYKVNKAYFIPDLSTEEIDDFYIVITDGEIISPFTDSNELEFSEATKNSVVFRGIPDRSGPVTTVGFAPNGSYEFNSNNSSFSFAQFNFNCEASNGILQMCQQSLVIEERIVPDVAIIDIEIEELTAINDINFEIELTESRIIQGHFRGVLDRIQSE